MRNLTSMVSVWSDGQRLYPCKIPLLCLLRTISLSSTPFERALCYSFPCRLIATKSMNPLGAAHLPKSDQKRIMSRLMFSRILLIFHGQGMTQVRVLRSYVCGSSSTIVHHSYFLQAQIPSTVHRGVESSNQSVEQPAESILSTVPEAPPEHAGQALFVDPSLLIEGRQTSHQRKRRREDSRDSQESPT